MLVCVLGGGRACTQRAASTSRIGVTLLLCLSCWPASVAIASLLLDSESNMCAFEWIFGESSQPVEAGQEQASGLFAQIPLAS